MVRGSKRGFRWVSDQAIEHDVAYRAMRTFAKFAYLPFAVIAGVGWLCYDLAPLKYDRDAEWRRVEANAKVGEPWSAAERRLNAAGFRIGPAFSHDSRWIWIRVPLSYRLYYEVRHRLDYDWESWTPIVGQIRATICVLEIRKLGLH